VRWAPGYCCRMLALMTFGLVPNVAACPGALAMILSGCLSIKDAYDSIQLAEPGADCRMLPWLKPWTNGGVNLSVIKWVVPGELGPHYLLLASLSITAGLSHLMSNTATCPAAP